MTLLVQRQSLTSYNPLSLHFLDIPSTLREFKSPLPTITTHPHGKTEFRKLALAEMSSRFQQVTGNINSFNSSNSRTGYYNIFNIAAGPDAEKHQIMQWLSPLQPQQRHQGVRTDRLDRVGNWALETSEFRKWCDAEDQCVSPVLFCHGNPGVGKTYIRYECPLLEKDNAGVTNEWQIIAP